VGCVDVVTERRREIRVGEGLIAAVVDEQDSQFLNTMVPAMLLCGGKAGNIKQTNAACPCETFLVARSWRLDGPPNDAIPCAILVRTRACRSGLRGVFAQVTPRRVAVHRGHT
jgi:hypothetical protein